MAMPYNIPPDELGAAGTTKPSDDPTFTITIKEWPIVSWITNLTARGSDSVNSIVDLLEERYGFPKDESRLICNGNIMDRGVLSDYGLEHNGVVFVERNVVRDIQVFVKSLDGRTVTVNIKSNAMVSELKSIVHARCIYKVYDLEVNQIRLVFNGKELDDDKKLSFYEMREGANVHLVFRLPGGV